MRLASLHVENYKSLDKLELKMPAPSTRDQLDAFVLGSKNGVGKSSLLECCALSMIGAAYPDLLKRDRRSREIADPYNLLVRSGTPKATVSAGLTVDGSPHQVALEITAHGIKRTSGDGVLREFADASWLRYGAFEEGDLFDSILGMNSEPLLLPPILTFHSYRKVMEGNSALGAMVDPSYARRTYPPRRFGGPGPLSIFKVVLVQALMARSGLFEGMQSKGDNEAILDKLNGLIRDFAGGTVDKLRPGPDGTLELRVAPNSGGHSFSFDGLSSGQKEIIATLFLIWFMTLERGSVVLIDEPELHLNAEWQRIFVHQLATLAPGNQYILATHSEEIFGSVTEERRLMLRRE
ncbi:MAG: AAA family ATPase [Polyangiales bacterium]